MLRETGIIDTVTTIATTEERPDWRGLCLRSTPGASSTRSSAHRITASSPRRSPACATDAARATGEDAVRRGNRSPLQPGQRRGGHPESFRHLSGSTESLTISILAATALLPAARAPRTTTTTSGLPWAAASPFGYTAGSCTRGGDAATIGQSGRGKTTPAAQGRRRCSLHLRVELRSQGGRERLLHQCHERDQHQRVVRHHPIGHSNSAWNNPVATQPISPA